MSAFVSLNQVGGVLVLAFGCWHSKGSRENRSKFIAEIEPHGVRRKRKKTLWYRVSHKMSDKRVYVPLLVQFRSCEKIRGSRRCLWLFSEASQTTECCSKAARCRFLSLTPPLPPFLAVPAMAADCSLVDAVYDMGLPAPAPLLRRCAVLLCIVVVVVCEVVSRCGSTRVCLLDDVAILPNNPPFCAGFPVVSLALGMWKGPMILVSIIDRQRRRTLQAQARRALLCGGGGGMGGGSAGTGQDSS